MKMKALLRRGRFTTWLTVNRMMEEIAVPMPDDISLVAYHDDKPENHKNEVWYFRLNQQIDEDMLEYLFDRVERR